MFRLVKRLLGIVSPSDPGKLAVIGMIMVEGVKAGIENSEHRHQELLASGMLPEKVRETMLNEMVSDPGFLAFTEHNEMIARRSFGYYDEEGE